MCVVSSGSSDSRFPFGVALSLKAVFFWDVENDLSYGTLSGVFRKGLGGLHRWRSSTA